MSKLLNFAIQWDCVLVSLDPSIALHGEVDLPCICPAFALLLAPLEWCDSRTSPSWHSVGF